MKRIIKMLIKWICFDPDKELKENMYQTVIGRYGKKKKWKI